jgi:hypothetical protein
LGAGAGLGPADVGATAPSGIPPPPPIVPGGIDPGLIDPLVPGTPPPIPPAFDCCASVDVTVVLDTCLDPDDRRPLDDPARITYLFVIFGIILIFKKKITFSFQKNNKLYVCVCVFYNLFGIVCSLLGSSF